MASLFPTASGNRRRAIPTKSSSSASKNPARPGCYFIDFEICNTGDKKMRFNGVQILWPKTEQPNPAPQPVPDQTLGWNAET